MVNVATKWILLAGAAGTSAQVYSLLSLAAAAAMLDCPHDDLPPLKGKNINLKKKKGNGLLSQRLAAAPN